MANIETMRAAVEISANVTGTQSVAGLTGAMVDLQNSTDALTRKQENYLKSLSMTASLFGKTKTEAMAMKAAMLGIPEQAVAPIISSLEKMGINGEHSFKAMITQGGVFRELLVLMHESLIMGNWSRFGGSLMVLSERMELAPVIFSAFGAAALGAAGGVAGLIAAMIKGEMESSNFAKSITLTGGMAGITEGQFRTMAAALGQAVPDAATKGRNALMELIATGQFSGDTLYAVGRAATELASYTGQSAADVVKSFSDMKGNAAEWAAKMNESYHFLSEAQYEYIVQLQKQGETEKAEQAAANDLFQSLADNGTKNLGYLQRAWEKVTGAVRGTFEAMEDIGRASTLDDQLATAIATRNSTRGDRSGANAQIADLQKQIAAQQKAAADKANNDQVQQKGIAANQLLTGKFAAPQDELKSAITAYNQAISDALVANPNDPFASALKNHTGAAYDAEIARLKKEYGGAGTKSRELNKPDINGYAVASDDPGRMETQISHMQEYAKATKQSETAVLALSIAQGKLNGFTAAQITELKNRAAADDALAAQKARTDADNKYSDTMGGLKDKSIDLSTQISQMENYGKVTKNAELNAINLQIAEGKYTGFTQAEIASVKEMAMNVDNLQQTYADYGRSAVGGTKEAFAGYVDQATDAGAQIKKVWGDVFTGMDDLLTTALSGGKVNFDAFALSVIQDLLKMEIQVNILGPLIAALGSAGGGSGGGGLLTSIVGTIAGAFSPGAGAGVDAGLNASSFTGAGPAMYANGGIMTSRGALPLNKYENGGIANSPQMAMFGEGRGPEAYVPLPDGRSIPVSMKGGGGGGGMVSNTFHIHQDGSTSGGDSTKQATQMSRAIIFTIQQELIRQKRDGGILSSTAGA